MARGPFSGQPYDNLLGLTLELLSQLRPPYAILIDTHREAARIGFWVVLRLRARLAACRSYGL